MKKLTAITQTFLADCAANGKSADTLQNYRTTLSRFVAWAGADADITDIKTADIAAFKASLGDVKVTTLSFHLEHLKLFFP